MGRPGGTGAGSDQAERLSPELRRIAVFLGVLVTLGPVQVGPRKIVLGALVLIAASTIAYTQIGRDTGFVLLSVALVLGGIGNGAALVSYLATPTTPSAKPRSPKPPAPRGSSNSSARPSASPHSVVLQHGLAHSVAGTGVIDAYRDAFWWARGFSLVAVLPAALPPCGSDTPGRQPVA